MIVRKSAITFVLGLLFLASVNTTKAMFQGKIPANMGEILLTDMVLMRLHKSGDSRTFEQLCDIKESNLKNVKKNIGTETESYQATLPDGDLLVADYFPEGPAKGQIVCTRCIFSILLKSGNKSPITSPAILPVDSKYFDILKKIVEREQKDTK